MDLEIPGAIGHHLPVFIVGQRASLSKHGKRTAMNQTGLANWIQPTFWGPNFRSDKTSMWIISPKKEHREHMGTQMIQPAETPD